MDPLKTKCIFLFKGPSKDQFYIPMVEGVQAAAEGCTVARDSAEALLKRLFTEKSIDFGHDNDMAEIFKSVDSVEALQIYLDVASQLLDKVETELVEEVSAKADSFFEAISAMGSLSDQTSSLSNAANNLNAVLSDIQERHAKEVAKLEQIINEQENLLKAQDLLGLMLDFVKSQNTIQMMLDTHEFTDASRLVAEKIQFLGKELLGITLFEPVLFELREMQVALEKMLRANMMA